MQSMVVSGSVFIVRSSPSMARRSLAAGLPAWGLRRAAALSDRRCAFPAGILPFGSSGEAGLDEDAGCFDGDGAIGQQHAAVHALAPARLGAVAPCFDPHDATVDRDRTAV